MAQPTETDRSNAMKYAEQRGKLMKLKKLYEKFPHIASHIKWGVNKADLHNDYYYPTTFEKRAIVVDIELTEAVFNQVNCYPWRKEGPCTQTSEPEYIRIGDVDDFKVACAPACFNLKETIEYSEDGNQIPQFPNLEYVDGKLKMASSTSLWMEIPLVRSEDRFTEKINNFREGFTKVPDPTKLYGFRYRYTDHYCQMFGAELSGEECKEPWYVMFLDAIIGKSFLFTVTEALSSTIAHTSPFTPHDKDPPEIDKEYYSVKNWRKRIDQTFKIPDVEIEAPNERLTTSSNCINKSTKELLRKVLYAGRKDNKDIDVNTRRFIDELTCAPTPMKIKPMTYAEIVALLAALGIGIESGNLAEFIFNYLKDPKFWIGFSDTVLFRVLTFATEKLGTYFAKLAADTAVRIGEKLAVRMVENTMMVVLRRTMTSMMFTLGSRFMVTAGKILAQIESVVGFVLILTTILDFVLSFWDPYGFGNQFPPGYLVDFQKNMDFAFLKQIESSDPTVTFDIFASFLLSSEELLELGVGEFEYVYEYLNSLVVNSEGSRIDKGDQIEIDFSNQTKDNEKMKADRTKIYTQSELFLYEQNHSIRLKNLKAYSVFGLIGIGIGFGFYFLGMSLIAILFIFVGICMMIFSYFIVENDSVFDVDLSELFSNFWSFVTTKSVKSNLKNGW